MKTTKTDITVILDRSGSMYSIEESTIAGFNRFLRDQQKEPEGTTLSLVQFDDLYEKVYTEKKIKKVKKLTKRTFVPRGATALLDAIGRTIISTQSRIIEKPEHQRPDNVILVIITDGYENASTEFSMNNINKKIHEVQAKHNWQLIYLGANQDAIAEASQFGIIAEHAMTYQATPKSASTMFDQLSENISFCKKAGIFSFTEEQRSKHI